MNDLPSPIVSEAAELAAAPARAPGLVATVREALAGSAQDFTEGSVGRAVLLLAVPMVLEMVMESLFALADIFWVSKLGADAVAAVGMTESLLSLIYALAMGLAMGATAVVARRTGEKRPALAARAAGQAIVLALLVSLPIALFGALFAPRLLSLMGASPRVVHAGRAYATIMLSGNATIVLLFLLNAVFRGAGDAAVAMRVLWVANGLNIVLGPVFIFGLHMGVTGAAVATTIGRGVGVVLQLAALRRANGRIRVGLADLRPEVRTLGQMLALSGSGLVQSLIGTASWMFLVRVVAAFGDAAVAGYTIGFRLIMFALLPSWGLANAAATMVGQNLGAKKPERAEAAVWRAGHYNLAALGGIGLVFVLGAEPIAGLFDRTPAVLHHAADCLRLVSLGFVFYAYGMVLMQALNGAGDVLTPTLLNLVCFWVLEIPLAWVLARPLGLGPRGVFTAVTVAFSTQAVLSGLIFRRGRWKAREV